MADDNGKARQAGDAEQSGQAGSKRIRILLGIAVVLAAAVGLYVFASREQPEPVVVEETVTGVIDFGQIMEMHPSYEERQNLLEEISRLQAVLAMEELEVELPEQKPDEELFQEAADQKSHLDAIERHAQLVEELNAFAEQKRQELKPQFEAERAEATRPYLNEILNLNLKLDNAEVLGITPEQQEEMLARIDELQQKKLEVLAEVNRDQEERFSQIIAEESAGPMAELRQLEEETAKEMQQQELEEAMEVQERNNKAMEEALAPVQKKISQARNRALLSGKELQLQQLEKTIYDDIAGRAAKLAIMHRLTMILALPASTVSPVSYGDGQAVDWVEILPKVINVNTIDLTDEMVKDIQTQPF